MKDIDKAVILISCLVVISFLCFVIKWVNADDGSGCSTPDSWGLSTNCFTQKIYQQNQILIQEQNQTNNLLKQQNKENAILICSIAQSYDQIGGIDYGTNPYRFDNWNKWNNCLERALNDTK